MAANLNTVFKEIHATIDLLSAEVLKMQSHIAAIQQRLDQQGAMREQQIGETKPRRGRPPSKGRY